MKEALLALEDGTVVEGRGLGAEGYSQGELVFTTCCTGYVESMTDPSYKGQNLLFSYPLIGNYGINFEEMQSDKVQPEGIVVREACDHPSHRKSGQRLEDFLFRFNTRGIANVDTRSLTRKIAEEGTMRSAIEVGECNSTRALDLARNQPEITKRDLVSLVSTPEPYEIMGSGPTVAVVDTGVKSEIINSLTELGMHLFVFPHFTPPKNISLVGPQALFLTNGPGDPLKATPAIETVNYFLGRLPIFGICFGAQLVSLACGAKTYKLKFGHRGSNQPVKKVDAEMVRITSQNHGFAVDEESLDGTGLKVSQINPNDGTVEGVVDKDRRIEAVQYHPEAAPGPRDTKESFFSEVKGLIGDNDAQAR